MSAIPLAALPVWLPEGPSAPVWTCDALDVPGRALVQTVAVPARFPVALDRPMTLHGHVRLPPGDWVDGSGSIRVAVAAADVGTGERQELWAGELASAARNGGPEGLAFAVDVPMSAAVLVLEAEQIGVRDVRAVGRVMWLSPVLAEAAGSPASGALPPALASAPAWEPGDPPLISVLTPVHDPPLQMLRDAVGSVVWQTFGGWQLCLLDDGSQRPEIIAALREYAASDERVVLARHERAQGIARATNAALELATGTFAALLDHDDWLEPTALQRVAQAITARPDLDMVYTDEDIVMNGRAIWVHPKPAWSPDVLRTNGYTCHLGVYRAALMRDIGGFRQEFDGSQDVDMILRLIERTERIGNVPEILYHWRAHASSTAGGDAKPYAYVSAQRAITAHLERVGVAADVDYGPPGLYRVIHRVDPATRAAIVTAATQPEDIESLERASASWSEQNHRAYAVLVAAPAELLAQLPDGVTGIEVPPGTSRAQALVRAADEAGDAEHLVVLERPMIGLTHDWLRRLLGYSAEPGIAAAGPVVLADDGRVVHGGVALPDGIPLYLLHGRRTSMDELFGFGTSVHNVTALSGALVTPRATYERLGGFDASLRELSLIDYCLRARASRDRIVTVPDARLQLSGPDDQATDVALLRELRRRWLDGPAAEPYYNPSYHFDRGDFAVRTPIR